VFICLCNSINGKQMREAAQRLGTAEPERIYADLGKSPRCGRCLEFARDFLAGHGKDLGLRSVTFAERSPLSLESCPKDIVYSTR